MIQTIVVPENAILNIDIPQNYIGKKVYALIYTDEELTVNNTIATNQTLFSFLETLHTEENEQVSSLILEKKNVSLAH